MRRVVTGSVVQVGVGDGRDAPLGDPLFDLWDGVPLDGDVPEIPLAEKLKVFRGKDVKITIETVKT